MTYDEFLKSAKGKVYAESPSGEEPVIIGITYDEFLKSPKGKAYATGAPVVESPEPAAKKDPVKADAKKASD